MSYPQAPQPPTFPPGYPPHSLPPPPPVAAPARIRKHGLLWIVSLLVGGGLIALGFLLHASWEHSRSYPRGLRNLVNHNEGAVLVGGGLLLTCLFATLAYRRGWFTRLPLQARLDLAAINAQLDAAGIVTFEVTTTHAGRLCYGTLVLTPGELMFHCFHDDSLLAASTGKAVSSQFGLIGGLIGGAVSGARAHARDKQIAAARAATASWPLDQQLAFNPHSFRVGPHELGGLTTRRGVRAIGTPKGEYFLQDLSDEQLGCVIAWLTRRGVHVASV